MDSSGYPALRNASLSRGTRLNRPHQSPRARMYVPHAPIFISRGGAVSIPYRSFTPCIHSFTATAILPPATSRPSYVRMWPTSCRRATKKRETHFRSYDLSAALTRDDNAPSV